MSEGTVYNAQGRINRLSVLCIDAYGVAVKNGYKGTVEEWLASLKGEKGESGAVAFDALTPEQIEQLRGKPFTYEDFTPEQLEGLKGDKGDPGEKGEKGEKGDKGDKGDTGATGAAGKDGADGQDGTSVTVSKVTESTADGGSNVVTFSDGKTVTIKNGSKGSTGAKGDDGSDGRRGTGLLPVTTAPSSYTTEVNGLTPKYRISLSTVKSQASTEEVYDGDTIQYSYYHYPVIYVDSSYVYCGTRVSIRGATGAAYTLNDDDKTAIAAEVKTTLGTLTVTGIDADGVSHSWTMYGVAQ